MNNPIDGTDGKLGYGFTSANELKEVDVGPRDRPRLTYVSAKLDPEYKQELIDLLKEFKDCFAWEYYEMPGLDQCRGPNTGVPNEVGLMTIKC